MRQERVEISCDGERICGVLHLPDQDQSPCVVISHGLFSDKGTVKFQEIADEFPREGLAVLRFDFMGCGESSGKIEDTTISGRLSNLTMMIDLAFTHPSIDHERIGLMGSSIGGYLSLFKGAVDERVKTLVVWATPYTLTDLKDKISSENEPELGPAFYSELDRYQLGSILNRISNCLVIHGDFDELIPVFHAYEIYQGLSDPKSLEIVNSADHRFSNVRHRLKARHLTLNWFRRFLWTK